MLHLAGRESPLVDGQMRLDNNVGETVAEEENDMDINRNADKHSRCEALPGSIHGRVGLLHGAEVTEASCEETRADLCSRTSELQTAKRRILENFDEGLRDGFFDLSVSSEIVNGKQRRVRIKMTSSDQFMVSPEEIDR